MSAETIEFVERVRAHSSIFSVVSRYFPLRFKNGRYWACCPFHDGDAESFTIAPEKGFFYCFQCHVGGNVFDFISMKEDVSYFEAIETQAKKLGFSIPRITRNIPKLYLRRRKSFLFKINRLAEDFYHKFLTRFDETETGRKYLDACGITGEAIEKFGMGFAPNEPYRLMNFFFKRKFSLQCLVDSGLISLQNGKVVERLRSCFVVPMKDVFGRFVSLGKVNLSYVAESRSSRLFDIPKTAIFDRDYFIFGLSGTAQSLLVVENYEDAIFLSNSGITDVVATCDVPLAEKQVQILLAYSNKIIFFRTKNGADLHEISDIFNVAQNFGNRFFVASMLKEMTIQNFIRENGKTEFIELLKNALPLFDCLLKFIFKLDDTSSLQEKIETLNKIYQMVPKNKNGEISGEYLRKISAALGLDINMIFEECQKLRHPIMDQGKKKPVDEENKVFLLESRFAEDPLFNQICRRILRTCWQEDALVDYPLCLITEENFSKVHREIIAYIKKCSDNEQRPDLEKASDELSEKAYAELLKILDLMDEDVDVFHDSVMTAYRICLQKSYDDKVKEADKYMADDTETYAALMKEAEKIKKDIDKIK